MKAKPKKKPKRYESRWVNFQKLVPKKGHRDLEPAKKKKKA